MTHERTPIRLSAIVADGDDWRAVIEQLTDTPIELPLEGLLAPLGLPFDVIDPIMTAIWSAHNEIVDAAFAAGLACGLHPEKLLLEVKP